MEYKDYEKLSDEDLVKISLTGDAIATEYIMARYKNLVRARARMYFLAGADKEDIIQEGMIGLFKAIRDYNHQKQASFHSFAELCIKRQIITAVKTATRQKHIPLNTYISLNKPVSEDDSERTLLDILSTIKISDPEELIIGKEEKARIENAITKVLSDLEMEVLQSYLDGKSYQEIACDLDRQAKSIDNALQRVKRKLEKCLSDNEQ